MTFLRATRPTISLAVLASALLAAACTTNAIGAAAGSEPAADGSTASSDIVDAEEPKEEDAGSNDAGPSDASSAPGEILGTLSGSCGLLKNLLGGTAPGFERDALVFAAGESYDKASLSPEAQRVYDTPNAGGSSTESEVMSFEILRACEGASLVKTETQIVYGPANGGSSAITDILVSIDGKKVGVSVTRAYKPSNQSFPDTDVKLLLEKKLEGINASSKRVVAADKWVKQVLHVFAANKSAADAVERVLPTISATLRADTVVLLTQTTGGGFLYCNPDPPLGSECP